MSVEAWTALEHITAMVCFAVVVGIFIWGMTR